MPMPVVMVVTMAVSMMVVTRGIHPPKVYCQSTGADHEKLFHVHNLWRIRSEGLMFMSTSLVPSIGSLLTCAVVPRQ